LTFNFSNLCRGKQLLLGELVEGALIKYLLYLSCRQGKLIIHEQEIDEPFLWGNKLGKYTPCWRNLSGIDIRNIVGTR